ncbi:MAG: amidohydrolase family protein [Anaerolineales bacterium]|jgi:predicted TIM-barrel fold metal-dependent hydrolase
MIVDIHAHIFPDLNGACGLESVELHRLYLQRFTAATPAQSVKRLSDGKPVENPEDASLWDPDDPTPSGALPVDFRVGRFGRLEWSKNGQDYYIHLYAPNLQLVESSPEFLLAQMNYAGVDTIVLQNAWLYGQLNDFFAAAVKKYPGRFIGTVQVNEAKAYQETEIKELRRGVEELGLKALYFANARFFESGFQHSYEDSLYEPFWEEVQALGIPVFWDLTAVQMQGMPKMSPYERFISQMHRFNTWLEKFPGVNSILVHGVPLRYIRDGNEFRPIPDEVWDTWSKPQVFVEMLFPMQVSHPSPGARAFDYPYRELHPIIKEVYNRLGAHKLVWGSDLPNVERNCTYKQARSYFTEYIDFIPNSDKELITGRNAVSLLGIG